MAKFTYEFVKEYFEKEGCKLLSEEYVNYTTKLHYVCQCGHEHFISFAHFKRGECRFCPKCIMEKSHKQQAHTYEYVKQYFEDNGYKLLSKEYKNNQTKLEFIAKCGHKHNIIFNAFKKNIDKNEETYCNKCFGIMKTRKSLLLSYDYVKKIFEDNGCLLIDKEYIGGKFKLNYIAQCGHKHRITFNNFLHYKKGKICPACVIKNNSGETHYNYKKDLTEKERIYRRHDKRNVEWRKQVFERDDYTCQITGQKGSYLAAHHLKSYSRYKELRFEIDNGITLNKEFHMFAHRIFGYKQDVDIGELVEAQFLWDSGCR